MIGQDFDNLTHIQSLDVRVILSQQGIKEEELLGNVEQPHVCFNSAAELQLSTLINYIKALGYPISGADVAYYSSISKLYVNCGKDPIPFYVTIPAFELYDVKSGTVFLRLKFRTKFEKTDQIELPVPEEAIPKQKRSSRRPKERHIDYILEKVRKWRNFYKGVKTKSGHMKKYSLDEAAEIVGIRKKSLDDYLLQIRFGKKYGFNFNAHKDERVGLLRGYVKKWKNLDKELQKYEGGKYISPEVWTSFCEPGTNVCQEADCCCPSIIKSRSKIN